MCMGFVWPLFDAYVTCIYLSLSLFMNRDIITVKLHALLLWAAFLI